MLFQVGQNLNLYCFALGETTLHSERTVYPPQYNIYSISKQIGTKLELNIFWRPVENVPHLKSQTGNSIVLKRIVVIIYRQFQWEM